MGHVSYTWLNQTVLPGSRSHKNRTKPRGPSDPWCLRMRTQWWQPSCPAFPLSLPSASLYIDWLHESSLSLSWLGESFIFWITAPYYTTRHHVTLSIITPLWLAFCESVCLKNAGKGCTELLTHGGLSKEGRDWVHGWCVWHSHQCLPSETLMSSIPSSIQHSTGGPS